MPKPRDIKQRLAAAIEAIEDIERDPKATWEDHLDALDEVLKCVKGRIDAIEQAHWRELKGEPR